MRDVQQSKSRDYAFNYIKEHTDTAFILRDWAQKILESRFREGMHQYFGKKGMSLHGDVILYVKNEELKKIAYYTCSKM